MTEITEITLENAKFLREIGMKALRESLEDFGVQVLGAKVKYSGVNATLSFEIALGSGDDAWRNTQAAQDFEHYAPLQGLTADALGRRFEYSGVTYEIRGWRPRATRRPIVVHGVEDGKSYSFPAHTVVMALRDA